MAKDIFLGCVGFIIGIPAFGIIGSMIDPGQQEFPNLWKLSLLPFLVMFAAGAIWLGSVF